MRTTPLALWRVQASRFDLTVRDAAEGILGYRFGGAGFTQACLTPRLGRLGLRRVVDHADIAFSASWFESRATCGEAWSVRPDVRSDAVSQKEESCVRDQERDC
jgi:hypothetical protein